MSSTAWICWSPTWTLSSRSRLGQAGVPAIGFYQHTDAETKRRAEAAGLAFAVPRSRMVRELPELVERALER